MTGKKAVPAALLSFEKIGRAVGKYLTSREIEAVMKRRLLLLEEIDEKIRKHGESLILYEFGD